MSAHLPWKQPGLLLALLLPFSCAFAQTLGINVAWAPITDADRQMRAPVVEKDAGVEALFWNVHVEDDIKGDKVQRILYHYVRLKIFDEKGKEKAATIDLPYDEHANIKYVAGRTVQPDGTVLDLKKDAIYNRDLLRTGKLRRKVVSFAMPGVAPGAIVEYRWQEWRFDPNTFYLRLQFQREFPVQKVTYFVKPLSRDYTSYRMSIWPFNSSPSPLKLETSGFQSTSIEKVPAFREEPFMPAEPNVRPWALIFYRDDGKRQPEKYWSDVGKRVYGELKQSLHVNNDVKKAADEAVKDAKTDDEKVLALIRYLRKNLRGLLDPRVTEAERTKVLSQMPKNRFRTSAEIFKSGIGSADELNVLFAAMASQAGLEARPALLPSRSDVAFDPRMTDDYFLRSIDMAVRIGETWKLYDIGARLLPPGMLTWQEEGVEALLSDPKKPEFIQTPISPPEASLSQRSARMKLSADGEIEGDVDEAYSGNEGLDRRIALEGESESKQQELAKEEITRVFSNAEVSQLRIENADDPELPLTVHYHVRIPGYATRTARRIVLQPFYFQRGSTPLFSAGERQYRIVLPHAWKEADDVTIEFPAGFELDKADNPGGIGLGNAGAYVLKMGTQDNNLVCYRELTFGRKGALTFDRSNYPAIKSAFDIIHQHDNHAITLKQTESGGK